MCRRRRLRRQSYRRTRRPHAGRTGCRRRRGPLSPRTRSSQHHAPSRRPARITPDLSPVEGTHGRAFINVALNIAPYLQLTPKAQACRPCRITAFCIPPVSLYLAHPLPATNRPKRVIPTEASRRFSSASLMLARRGGRRCRLAQLARLGGGGACPPRGDRSSPCLKFSSTAPLPYVRLP